VLDQPAFTANARQVAQMLATEAATNPTAADEIEAIVGTTSARDT
jgi:hypothetical protein